MTGTILIVDGISTNRIVLKVKLASAFYRVLQARTAAEAVRITRRFNPDLAVIGDTIEDKTATRLCETLKTLPQGRHMPVVMISADQQVDTRLEALRAGADDVLIKPIDDTVMLARLRSLLRARDAEQELQLRDGTDRALGFAEDQNLFRAPGEVAIVANRLRDAKPVAHDIAKVTPHRVSAMSINSLLSRLEPLDCLVLHLSEESADRDLALLSELRSRGATRHAGIIVTLPGERAQAAASALDLGANDILPAPFHMAELGLRVDAQLTRKRMSDKLRDRLRDGMRAAVTDPLTGLYNRRYALPHLDRALRRAHETGRACAVMAVDIDHFKHVNDRYGHAAGDAVLSEVAARLRDNLRAVDLIARTGGEEFMIVMPDTTREAACGAADRMCALIRDFSFALPESDQRIDITISIGLTLSGEHDTSAQRSGPMTPDTVEKAMARADKALYRAKENGRNRVRLSQAEAA